MIYTETFLNVLSKRQWKPDWLTIGKSQILPIMINKFSTPFSDKEISLVLNFTKKNLNYIKFNGKITCVAIVEKEDEKRRLKNIWNKNDEMFDYIFTVNELIIWLEENCMKFDKIIMNPPYSKNLHLKVLEKAIENLSDNGECINLSPIRWLQDPLAKYKKNSDYHRFEENVSKHIKNIEEISIDDSQKLFNALINTNLAIYILNNNVYNVYKNIWKNKTNEIHFEKVRKYWQFPKFEKFNEEKNKTKFFVTLRSITNPARTTFYNIYSNVGILKNSKTLTGENYKDVMYKSKTFSEDRQLIGIWFDNEIQANNFLLSIKTIFYKYTCSLFIRDVHISNKYLLWMGECINPRTGLKGYESEWTNEDFYKFFDITKEEQKIIEATMEKYR